MAAPSDAQPPAGPLVDQEGRSYRLLEVPQPFFGGVVRAAVEHIGGTSLPDPGPYEVMLPDSDRGRASIEQLVAVSGGCPVPPCPRPLSRLKEPGGVVIPAHPASLEEWWRREARDPSAVLMLLEVLAEIGERLSDYRSFSWEHPPAEPLLSPWTICRRAGGPWRICGLHHVALELPDLEEEGLQEGWDWPPELLFRAQRHHAAAADSWKLGELMLRMFRYRLETRGGAGDTNTSMGSHRFRSQRCRLVEDLFLRKPKLSLHRPIQPNDFLYPDSLPDADLDVVRDSLEGLFGSPMPAVEKRIREPLTAALSRAMAIKPSARFLEARELSSDLRAIAKEARALMARYRPPPAGTEAEGQTETRLLADVLPVAPPASPPAAHAEIGELTQRLQRIESLVAQLQKRVSAQEKQLAAVAGYETAAYAPPQRSMEEVSSSPGSRKGGGWLVAAGGLSGVALAAGLVWLHARTAALEQQPPPEEAPPEIAQEPEGQPPPSLEAGASEGARAPQGAAVEVAVDETAEPEPRAKEQPVVSSLDREPAPEKLSGGSEAARGKTSEVAVSSASVTFVAGQGYLEDVHGARADMGAVPAGQYSVWWGAAGQPAAPITPKVQIHGAGDIRLRCDRVLDRCKVLTD